MLVIGSTYRPTDMTISAIISLSAAVVIALITPREWAPPPVHFNLIQRPTDAGPAPEEISSWFDLYLSYAWLTPLVWKGTPSNPKMLRWALLLNSEYELIRSTSRMS